MRPELRIGGAAHGRESKSEAHDERDVVATEAEIDRGCGEWSIGGVGDAGGSETRPYWRIGVEQASSCNSMDEPGTNLLQRGALT